jgi:hypothetical protein
MNERMNEWDEIKRHEMNEQQSKKMEQIEQYVYTA